MEVLETEQRGALVIKDNYVKQMEHAHQVNTGNHICGHNLFHEQNILITYYKFSDNSQSYNQIQG